MLRNRAYGILRRLLRRLALDADEPRRRALGELLLVLGNRERAHVGVLQRDAVQRDLELRTLVPDAHRVPAAVWKERARDPRRRGSV